MQWQAYLQLSEGVGVVSQTQGVEGTTGVKGVKALAQGATVDTVGLSTAHQDDLQKAQPKRLRPKVWHQVPNTQDSGLQAAQALFCAVPKEDGTKADPYLDLILKLPSIEVRTGSGMRVTAGRATYACFTLAVEQRTWTARVAMMLWACTRVELPR